MDHRDAARLEQRQEILLEVDVLAGADRRGARVGQAHVLVGHLPGDHVLVPGQVELVQALGDLDAVLDADVAKVIGGQRHLVADDRAHLGDVLLHHVQPLFGDVDAGEGVLHVVHLEKAGGAALRASRGPRCGTAPTSSAGAAARSIKSARARERAGHVAQQADAHVHLEEGEAHLHALLERLAHRLAGVAAMHVGVAVDAHLVAELAAQHRVDGHAVGLAGQVPQRHLDAAHAAALARVVAELLDPAKDLVHVARVLAQDAALEHQGIALAGPVAHLAIALDALVGADLDQRAAHRRADDGGDAHVGDAQVRGTGIGVDVVQGRVVGLCARRHVGESPPKVGLTYNYRPVAAEWQRPSSRRRGFPHCVLVEKGDNAIAQFQPLSNSANQVPPRFQPNSSSGQVFYAL